MHTAKMIAAVDNTRVRVKVATGAKASEVSTFAMIDQPAALVESCGHGVDGRGDRGRRGSDSGEDRLVRAEHRGHEIVRRTQVVVGPRLAARLGWQAAQGLVRAWRASVRRAVCVGRTQGHGASLGTCAAGGQYQFS